MASAPEEAREFKTLTGYLCQGPIGKTEAKLSTPSVKGFTIRTSGRKQKVKDDSTKDEGTRHWRPQFEALRWKILERFLEKS